MPDFKETHPFQVSIWIPGNNNPNSLFERGHWTEYARCMTKYRALEVALCLSLRHFMGVQISQLIEDERGCRFVGYHYLPLTAKKLGLLEGQKQ